MLKHGTLSVGFIGLAEALKALLGVHHGEARNRTESRSRISSAHMRKRMDDMSAETHLNFSVLATPSSEGLSGSFVRHGQRTLRLHRRCHRQRLLHKQLPYSCILPISAYKKIQLEAPYHALTNAGHFTYVELDGDPAHKPWMRIRKGHPLHEGAGHRLRLHQPSR